MVRFVGRAQRHVKGTFLFPFARKKLHLSESRDGDYLFPNWRLGRAVLAQGIPLHLSVSLNFYRSESFVCLSRDDCFRITSDYVYVRSFGSEVQAIEVAQTLPEMRTRDDAAKKSQEHRIIMANASYTHVLCSSRSMYDRVRGIKNSRT